MRLADTLMGTVPAYVPHTTNLQTCEAFTEDRTTLIRRPIGKVGEYYIHKHVMGGYVVNGPGIQNHHISSLAKSRRIIDLMAQEQQWSNT